MIIAWDVGSLKVSGAHCFTWILPCLMAEKPSEVCLISVVLANIKLKEYEESCISAKHNTGLIVSKSEWSTK